MTRFTTPVTIVTGFLGCGKTTLINRILKESHGARIAVIENEYGEVGVDAEFLATGGDETIIMLQNGCLCCSVRGDLARALQDLAGRGIAFDRVLIETTGIADPGPVIQTFLAETRLQTLFHLDGTITLVDGHHGLIADRPEIRAQIGHADRLLITKGDLLAGDAADLAATLHAINPRAPVRLVDLHQIPMAELFDLLFETRAYAPDYIPADELTLLAGAPPAPMHVHDVMSCVYRGEAALDLEGLNQLFDALLARFGAKMWRCKGVVYARGHRQRLIVQGVQGAVQISAGLVWRPYEPRRSILVFIGQDVAPAWILQCLRDCEIEPEILNYLCNQPAGTS